jgi:two-component system sensor histidine kinase KdpD
LILNVHPTPYDALDYNEWQTQYLFRTLAEKYALPLFERVSPASAAADVIVATINEQSVTQVVLGQTAKNRLEAMFGNSMVNQLLKKAPGVAIHIMAVNRVDRSGMAFDKGLNAWLSEYDESSYRLCFEKPAHPTTDGVFFKRAATDFEHGYFVTAGKDGRPNVFPVVNSKVSREDWTKKTLSQISFALCGLACS